MGGLSLAVTHPDTGIQNVSEDLDVFDQRQTLKRVRTLSDHQKQEIQHLLLKLLLLIQRLERIVRACLQIVLDIFVCVQKINIFP